MKVAILGAGFSGLTAALELNKAEHEVTIYEKNSQPGGAAGGFKEQNWDWYLDFAYHHWFTNDRDVLDLCREIGWKKIRTVRPITASLYENSESYKLDSPVDLLRFQRIGILDRIRAGMVLALLKFGPPLPWYHKTTSYRLLTALMGKRAFGELFQPLFEKKFGEYADRINTMFMWARITKRTPALSYPEGGYQTLANYFSNLLTGKGVKILYNTEVKSVARVNSKFKIKNSKSISNSKFEVNTYDIVINTLPSPIFLKLEKNILPDNYRKKLSGIKYLGAQTVILETKQPILDQTYWLNLTSKNNPWMVAIQHTNFMDRKHFAGHHLFYLATYTNKPLNFQLSNLPTFLPSNQVIKKWEFSIPYAQPLYTTDFTDNVPDYKTPVPGLFFANMEMTYPYDRGTNYAVKVGRTVAEKILNP